MTAVYVDGAFKVPKFEELYFLINRPWLLAALWTNYEAPKKEA
jgi:hypothetical protein